MSRIRWFEAYQKGDDDALIKLIDQERSALFDYVLRMTGEVARSLEAIEEVVDAVIAKKPRYGSYEELRVTLYQTGRNFNADIWNGDTSQLENDAMRREEWGESSDSDAIAKVERAFRSLRGPEREPLLLKDRLEFDDSLATKIMGITPSKFAELRQQGLVNLRAKVGREIPLPATIQLMYDHPLPKPTTASTVALSQLIANVDRAKARRGLGARGILGLFIAMGALAAAYFFFSRFVGRIGP